MPRNISFSLTTPQFIAQTKTITRRLGWRFLLPGDILCGVEKAMGLKKGEKLKRLGLIEVLSVRWEPLCDITQADVIAEGFPEWTPKQFVEFFTHGAQIGAHHPVNRIEFKYLKPITNQKQSKGI